MGGKVGRWCVKTHLTVVGKFGSLEVWMEKRGKAAAEKEEVGKVGSVEVGSVGEAFF